MTGDLRFWTLFGGIWLLVGAGFVITSLGAMWFATAPATSDAPPLWAFAAIGVAAAAAGGAIIYLARRAEARDRRLMEGGIRLTATITGIRQSAIRINRQPRYHVAYRYEYTKGRPFTGESRGMSAEAVERFKPGEQAAIKVDPQRPQTSLFLGEG